MRIALRGQRKDSTVIPCQAVTIFLFRLYVGKHGAQQRMRCYVCQNRSREGVRDDRRKAILVTCDQYGVPIDETICLNASFELQFEQDIISSPAFIVWIKMIFHDDQNNRPREAASFLNFWDCRSSKIIEGVVVHVSG